MRKLILILLAFIALFTFLSTFEKAEAATGSFADSSEKTVIYIEKSVKPVEIVQ